MVSNVQATPDIAATVRLSSDLGGIAAKVEALGRPMREQMERMQAATRPIREEMDRWQAATRLLAEQTAKLSALATPASTLVKAWSASALVMPASGALSALLSDSPGMQAFRDAFRRYKAMTPRQRARALFMEVRRRAGRLLGAARRAIVAAIGRTTANLAALVGAAPGALTDANPPPGRAFALVLLDSTRPVHGPPALPA